MFEVFIAIVIVMGFGMDGVVLYTFTKDKGY